MEIGRWISDLQLLLDELEHIELGYPLGDNKICPALPAEAVSQLASRSDLTALGQVRAFYDQCNGIDLPDVWNGYFVHGLEIVCRGEVRAIQGVVNASVVVLGSDGGGGKFAVRTIEQDVLHLSSQGVHSGIYMAGEGSVRIIAQDFGQFLDRLYADVEAFVRNSPGHTFMI